MFCASLAFIVSDDSQQDAVFHIKKIIVFCFAGNKELCTGSDRFGNKESSASSAQRDLADFSSRKVRMTERVQFQCLFDAL